MLSGIAITFLATLLSGASLTDASSCTIRDASAIGQAVWLLCEEGQVALRDENGSTLSTQALPTDSEMRAIRFLDQNRGVVAGENGTLLLTEDSGASWRVVATSTSEHLTSIHSVGDSVWVTGWGGVILHSTDGGETWTQQATGVYQSLESVYFVDELHGWAVGWTGTILRTDSGGDLWEPVRSSAAQWTLNSVYFRDLDNGWAVGFNGQILRSEDGGLTWEAQSSPVTNTLRSVMFDRDGRGWIATEDGLLSSGDDGRNWEHVHIKDWLFLNSLVRVGNTLWAVGTESVLRQEGTVLSWTEVVDFASESLASVDS